MLKAIAIFLLAALCEVGGGYLIWLWFKESQAAWLGLIGAVLLVLYGIVACFQSADFGRVYAAYGGIFVVFSIVWAMKFDGFMPDKWDVIGAFLILLGVAVLYFAPR